MRYLLEGSVRKAANRLRITAQLVDTSTGAHLWAEKFDGSMEDVFDLQDQVAASVVGTVAPRVEQAEIERVRHKPTENLDAYDCYLRGLAAFHEFTVPANEEALAQFQRAVALDPAFSSALGMATRCYAQRKGFGWSTEDAGEGVLARTLARQAVEVGRDDAVGRWRRRASRWWSTERSPTVQRT